MTPQQAGAKVRHPWMLSVGGTGSEVGVEHEVQSLSLRCSHIRMPQVHAQNYTGSGIRRPFKKKLTNMLGTVYIWQPFRSSE